MNPLRALRDARWLVASLVAGAAACSSGTPPDSQKSPDAASRAIDVVQVVEQPMDVTLSMPGELQAYQTVAVFPRVTGFVKSIDVDRGSRVHAGQVVATLDAPELTAQRGEAQSKVQGAEAQLNAATAKAASDSSSYEKLKAAAVTPGVVAGNELTVAQKAAEASQSQVTAAEQNVEAARESLTSVADMEGYLRVTAPFNGVVTERNIHPGALVGPNSGQAGGAPMLRIDENDRLRLVVPVPEAYTAGVTAGVPMPFTVAAYPGQTFSGTVARIAQAVDVRTRTMAVELDVPNTDGRLSSGAFCQVRWPVRRPGPSLLVPSTTIASTTDRTFVIRIRNGQTEWVDVKTGLTTGTMIEVFGDLHSGDTIAARGTDELRPGTKVTAKEAKRTSALSGPRIWGTSAT